MALPNNIAAPTLVTGKTNKSQVVDVYENVAAVKENSAQNLIDSVLKGGTSDLFGNVLKGLSGVFDAGKIAKDLNSLTDSIINGDLSSSKVKEMLNSYKDGAINTVLKSSGLPSLDVIKNTTLDNVKDVLKGAAFGYSEAFLNSVQPGLLDALGIWSYDDVSDIYKSIANKSEKINNADLGSSEIIFTDGTSIIMDIPAPIAKGYIDMVDAVLKPLNPPSNFRDKAIDNAVLTSVAVPLIKQNNYQLNRYMLDAFQSDNEGLKSFVGRVLPKASELGSYEFITTAAEKVGDTLVGLSLRYKPKITETLDIPVSPKSIEIKKRVQEKIVEAISIARGKEIQELHPDDFSGVKSSVVEVLQGSPVIIPAILAHSTSGTSVRNMYYDQFSDFFDVDGKGA